MRMMVYRGTGGLTVAGTGFGRAFADGTFVDFDEVAGHVDRDVVTQVEPRLTERKRIAVTWAEAIGERYVHLFEPAAEINRDDTLPVRARFRQSPAQAVAPLAPQE